ncbi:MAG: MBL fold metallo-hydrolase [Saprospirales bacterium]|nr:MBL fold metallo-hydrolase [Saprospirales bacterium]MBK8489869.1 MBL fold metallo-hydrolase [Saprospirales bacterium]
MENTGTKVVSLTFNPFQENTYLVYDETGECAIVDPGCWDQREKDELKKYLEEHQLKPVRLLNTHCHIDHVFGNHFVAETWGLALEIHRGELPILESAPATAAYFGVPHYDPSPAPGRFIEEGEEVRFGNTVLKALLTPGHSPASISFFCEKSRFLLSGDVLFWQSIGRTDLPGGDYDTLIASIENVVMPLGDDVTVYPGHGPHTSIGYERDYNPFLK